MKASVKFREDQKPLVRAKIPLNILGFPFLSGISAGESKELCLNLSTFFEIGPSVKISYRPNDSWNPFSLVIKTGIGLWGSPISAPMAMSAEFNLHNRGNPTFFLQFKPQIGDFSVRKTAGSSLVLSGRNSGFGPRSIGINTEADSEGDESVDEGEIPRENGGFRLSLPETNGFTDRKMTGVSPGFQPSVIANMISGIEMSAKSVLPIRKQAVVNIRWGIRLPAAFPGVLEEGKSFPAAGISLKKLPFLVMSKIGIEHVEEKNERKGCDSTSRMNLPASGIPAGAAVCYSVQHQLDLLRTENGLLKKAVEELRSEFGAGKLSEAFEIENPGGFDQARDGKSSEKNKSRQTAGKKGRRSESKSPEFGAGKVSEDLDDELKKVLTGNSCAGI